MSISIEVSIMCHPSRTQNAQHLVSALSKFPARVVFDPDPDGPRGTMRTAREAWRPWLPGATHHVVLQDDVLLHPDFEEQVVAAVESQPKAILSFFSEWGSYTSHALRIAAVGGFSWVQQPDIYLATQAAVMPITSASIFAMELQHKPLEEPDDEALWGFAHEHQIKHYASNPNLVQHDVQLSLVSNDFQGPRRATSFMQELKPPGGWWDKPPLALRAMPAFFHWGTPRAITYSCVDQAEERWEATPSVDVWGRLRPDISRLVVETIDAEIDSRTSAVLRSIGSDAAEILCDQVAVGKAVGARHLRKRDRFARQCAQSALDSLVPGCFRQINFEEGLNVDHESWSRVIRELTGVISQQYVPKLDVGAIRDRYLSNMPV